jgi:hypothetical protein
MKITWLRGQGRSSWLIARPRPCHYFLPWIEEAGSAWLERTATHCDRLGHPGFLSSSAMLSAGGRCTGTNPAIAPFSLLETAVCEQNRGEP